MAASSSSSSSSSRVGHAQQQQLQRASTAPVGSPEASTSNSAKSNVKLSVTSKALTTSAKRYSVSALNFPVLFCADSLADQLCAGFDL